jgi:glycosyltransferase involved in cell wall biosynthesis
MMYFANKLGADDPLLLGSPNVLFVTTGYPTRDRPNQCIFIHRSIKTLSSQIPIQVIHLRAWLPGRAMLEKRRWDGVSVISIACPQLYGGSYSFINAVLLSFWGAFLAKSFIGPSDIIHSTDIYPGGYVARQWAKRFGKLNSTHVIGSDLNLFLTPNLSRTGKLWLSELDGIVCNSQALKTQLLALAPGLNNVRVIYRGVDNLKFTPDGPVVGPQVSMPAVRFLYLGGFHTWDMLRGEYNIKGGHTLLSAWRKVEEQIAPSSLVIAGPGADTENLRKWRLTLRRPDSVFIANTISPDSIASWMRSCDVVVVPSLQEGLPNVANEAQACGCPVLGTDAGGIGESVINGETGLIVPRGDSNALAEGLEWCWINRASLKEIGKSGRKRMLSKFSWERFSQEMLLLFAEISKSKLVS